MKHEIAWWELVTGAAGGAFIASALAFVMLSPPLQTFLISYGAIANLIGVAVQAASILYVRHLSKRLNDARKRVDGAGEELTRRHRAAIATIAKGEAMGFIIENFEMREEGQVGPKPSRLH
jgi:hypothetical protein